MNTFSQHEFEAAIYRTLKYGDETLLAEAAGKSPGYNSQKKNPGDPRESLWYRAARDFYNLIADDGTSGCKALEVFNSFAKSALPRDSKLCVDTEISKHLSETADVTIGRLKGQSLYDLLNEAVESESQAARVKDAILAEINKEKSAVNGSGRMKAVR